MKSVFFCTRELNWLQINDPKIHTIYVYIEISLKKTHNIKKELSIIYCLKKKLISDLYTTVLCFAETFKFEKGGLEKVVDLAVLKVNWLFHFQQPRFGTSIASLL